MLRPQELHRIEPLIVAVDRNGYNPSRAQDICKKLPWETAPLASEVDAHWSHHFPISTVQRTGATEVIETLRAGRLSLGIVTNGSTRAQQTKIDVLRLHRAFDAVIISESEGVKKPDGRVFSAALSKLDADAESTWFVGDHPVNDILGAQEAGLTAVWLQGYHSWPPSHPGPRMTISNLYDLPRLVAAA